MSGEILAFIGTYTEAIRFGTGEIMQGKGQGIHTLYLDPQTGAMRAGPVTKGVINPSFLALDTAQDHLYAVNELKSHGDVFGGTVSAFRLDRASGQLSFLNRQPSLGTDPCHVVVDDRAKVAIISNFMSGSVTLLPVAADGSLGAPSDFIQHIGSGADPGRQAGPHAHAATLDPQGPWVFVPDLGLDKLMIYRMDAARQMLEPGPVPSVKMKPGAGPRHLALHPGNRFGYLVNELNSTVSMLDLNREIGGFRYLGTVPTLPEGFSGHSTCADIQVSPSGHALYASNRGHDSIVSWQINAGTGLLGQPTWVSTGGRTPRAFGIEAGGRVLVAANQDSDLLVSFLIDPVTGTLSATGHSLAMPTPVCVQFVR
ncbi:MAG: lactonase family protein [Paracoccaceae bacterium]